MRGGMCERHHRLLMKGRVALRHHGSSLVRLLLALPPAMALLVAGGAYAATGATTPAATAAAGPVVSTVTSWKMQAAPMAWAQGRIYYNQKGASGTFDGWVADPDGSNAACVTCGSLYPAGTHHGISDVTTDGRYALATVERSGHWPMPNGLSIAAPGSGAYNDLWLQKSDGS